MAKKYSKALKDDRITGSVYVMLEWIIIITDSYLEKKVWWMTKFQTVKSIIVSIQNNFFLCKHKSMDLGYNGTTCTTEPLTNNANTMNHQDMEKYFRPDNKLPLNLEIVLPEVYRCLWNETNLFSVKEITVGQFIQQKVFTIFKYLGHLPYLCRYIYFKTG